MFESVALAGGKVHVFSLLTGFKFMRFRALYTAPSHNPLLRPTLNESMRLLEYVTLFAVQTKICKVFEL